MYHFSVTTSVSKQDSVELSGMDNYVVQYSTSCCSGRTEDRNDKPVYLLCCPGKTEDGNGKLIYFAVLVRLRIEMVSLFTLLFWQD